MDDSDYDDHDYDDEYIPDEGEEMGFQWDKEVASIEEGHDLLRAFVREHTGSTSYALLSNLDGKLSVRFKHAKPCYGELRPYGSDKREVIHPDQVGTRGKDKKPGDLPGFFPKGKIEAISVARPSSYVPLGDDKRMWDWLLSKEVSPWRKLFDDNFEQISMVTEERSAGFLFKDTKRGPSPIVQFLMTTARLPAQYLNLKYFGDHPLAPLASWCISPPGWGSTYAALNGGGDGYTLNLRNANLSRLGSGDFYDIDGGVTLYDGAAYNRPNIEFVFGHGRKNEFLAKGEDGTTKLVPEEFLSKLDAAMKEPDDGLGFSAEGKDPLIKIQFGG